MLSSDLEFSRCFLVVKPQKAARMRLWRRHETDLPRPSKTPQTSLSTEPRPVRVAASGGNCRRAAARWTDLHQCRRPGAGAANAGHKRSALSDEFVDDGVSVTIAS